MHLESFLNREEYKKTNLICVKSVIVCVNLWFNILSTGIPYRHHINFTARRGKLPFVPLDNPETFLSTIDGGFDF